MAYLIIVVLLVAVVWVVSAPLRRGSAAAAGPHSQREESMRRIDLEAARDAKYREIRDAELDHQTGKLSDDDYAAIDSTLRAEAVELLHQLDELAAVEDQDAADDRDALDDQDAADGQDALDDHEPLGERGIDDPRYRNTGPDRR